MFAGLLPQPHSDEVIKLLFLLAHWHGLTKLRMHTDETLDILETVTGQLGGELRTFVGETCTAFATKELRREAESRRRRQARESTGGASQPRALANANDRRPKVLNLSTYKLHALGDYAAQIRLYGTTDSYSTQLVRRFSLPSYLGLNVVFRANWNIGLARLAFPEQVAKCSCLS